jgi:hypothetical protein
MDLKQRFETWWHEEGSGMPPKPGEDAEEHVKRVSKIAWLNGAYVQNKIATKQHSRGRKPVTGRFETREELEVRVLESYYHNTELSAAAVARMYHVSPAVVCKILEDHKNDWERFMKKWYRKDSE